MVANKYKKVAGRNEEILQPLYSVYNSNTNFHQKLLRGIDHGMIAKIVQNRSPIFGPRNFCMK